MQRKDFALGYVSTGYGQCDYLTASNQSHRITPASRALLERNNNPTETEIRYWLAGNLCRCTGYDKIIHAVMEVAAEMREAAK